LIFELSIELVLDLWYLNMLNFISTIFVVGARMTGKVHGGGDGNFIGNNDLENLEEQKWKRHQ
jgi:hypothetical protein